MVGACEKMLTEPRFDTGALQWDKRGVKVRNLAAAKKTTGTEMVEKYRPRMNKLTPAERQQLRDRAMSLAFGHESQSPANPRR